MLTTSGNLRVDEQVALLAARWGAIEHFVRVHPSGPWMCSITRSGLRTLIAPPTWWTVVYRRRTAAVTVDDVAIRGVGAARSRSVGKWNGAESVVRSQGGV